MTVHWIKDKVQESLCNLTTISHPMTFQIFFLIPILSPHPSSYGTVQSPSGVGVRGRGYHSIKGNRAQVCLIITFLKPLPLGLERKRGTTKDAASVS